MKSLLKLVVSILLFAGFSSAQAVVVTECGTNICYTYDNATLFGDGDIVGDSISFKPDNFLALSENGAGGVTETETLQITVTLTQAGIDSNYQMDAFYLFESGDYKLNNDADSVEAGAFFSVESQTQQCGFVACYEEDIQNFLAGDSTGGALTSWDLLNSVILEGNEDWSGDTEVIITLQNTLTATSNSAGSTAFIQKKRGAVGISINEPVPPSAIPVPAAAWLFMSGLLGLVGISRRKR